jgi:hypothetical protein
MTPEAIAQWMFEELKREKYLYQEAVVTDIASKFGDQFTYINENGNLAIDRRVLREFRKLTETTGVWERGGRLWRLREGYDESGRRQD